MCRSSIARALHSVHVRYVTFSARVLHPVTFTARVLHPVHVSYIQSYYSHRVQQMLV